MISEAERKRRQEIIAGNRKSLNTETKIIDEVERKRRQEIIAANRNETTDKRNNSDSFSSAVQKSSPTPSRPVNMREDEALRTLAKQMQNAPDTKQTEILDDYIRSRQTGTQGAATVLRHKENQQAAAYQKEAAGYFEEQAAKKAATEHIPVAAEKYSMMSDEELKADFDSTGNELASAEITKRYKDRFYSMSDEERKLVAQINAFDEGYSKDGGARMNAAAELKNKYNYTNDDITAMVYFYNRYANKEKAKQEDIDSRVAMDRHPFLESLASVPKGVAGGVMATVGIADSALDNKGVKKIGIEDQGLDYNNEFSSLQRQAQSGRSEFTDTHDLMIGEYDVGDLLYNTALSGVESAAVAFVPGGAALLGVNAATAKANELSQRGLSTEQSVVGGIVSGVIETLCEAKSIENIDALKQVDAKTLKDVALNIAKSMGVNFQEEATTEALNLIYDVVFHGDKSEFEIEKSNLVANGMSEKEAFKKALKGTLFQVAEAGVSGAIMGAGFGAAGAGTSYIGNHANLANAGTLAKAAEQTGAIINEGQAAPEKSKAHKLAESIVKAQGKGKEISDYKLGLLQYENSRQGKVAEGTFAGIGNEADLEKAFDEKLLQLTAEKKKSDNKVRQLYNDMQHQKARNSLYEEYKAANAELQKSGGREGMREAFEETLKEDVKRRSEAEKLRSEILTADGTQSKLDGSGIFKNSEGFNTVKTEDGKEIKVSELEFKDENTKKLYDATEGMTAEKANLFVSEYNGETVAEYGRAFDYYYRMGRTGMSVENIRKGDNIFSGVLSEEAQAKIATAGLKGREFQKGFTDLSAARKSERYKYESKVLQAVGEKRNLEIFVIDEDSDINGSYLAGTNRIVIRRNAEGRLLLRTAGHEAFHFIKNQVKDEAGKADVEALENFVLDALGKNGTDIEAKISRLGSLKDREGNTVYQTREDCIEEIVADSMFDVFTNEKFTRELMNENRSLFGKIANKVKEILADIKSAIRMLGNSDATIRALQDDVDSLEKINSMFDSLLAKAGESYKAESEKGQKNNTQGGVKYSFAAAQRTRPEVITQAERMEKSGATQEEIWKKLGLVRDASGIWVYEIDDSGMKIYPNGDALIRKEKGYQRMMAIFNKAFIDGEQLTEAEQKEYSELDQKYRVKKKTAWKVEDFVEHDELFYNYPQLRNAGFEFVALGDSSKAGSYNPRTNTVYISDTRRKSLHSLSDTVIHEIQHAIQSIDKRANGSNVGYWENRMSFGERFGKNDRKIDDIRNKRYSVFEKMSEELRQKVREINRERLKAIESGNFDVFDKLQTELIENDDTGLYQEYDNYLFEEDYLENGNELLSAHDLYRNTAGEIEARETSSRLKMPPDERAEKMPDLGWERAVFAEYSESYSINEEINKYGIEKWNDYIHIQKRVIETLKEDKFLGEKGRLIIHNESLKADIELSFKGIKETLGSNSKFQTLPKAIKEKKVATIKMLPELIRNAVVKLDNEKNYHNNDSKVSYAYIEADVLIDGKPNKVIMDIRKSPQKNLFWVHSIYDIKENQTLLESSGQSPKLALNEMSDLRKNDNTYIAESQADNFLKQKLSVKLSSENLSELKGKRASLAEEYRKIRTQIDEIESSDEYKAFNNEVRTVRKNGSLFGGFEAVKKIRERQKQWADNVGLSKLKEKYDEISEQLHDYDFEIYKLDKEIKEKATEKLTEKVKGFTHNEIMDYAMRARKKFGITINYDNAGYMLPNGELLDFSDGHGYRVLDHREINDILDFLPENHGTSDGLIQFMNMGNIRMQYGGIDISKEPTKSQITELRKFFNKHNGEITVDFSKENGDNAGSVEYPAGTSSSRILNDIKMYFESGILPQISTAATFHTMYSTKKTTPIQAYWAEAIKENHNFRNVLTLLDEMQSSGGKIQLDSRSIDKIAKDIIKTTSSKYEREAFADELTVLYDYMANSRQNADTEEIFSSVLAVAERVLEKSEMKDTELYDQYKNVRDYLRNQPIYITPAVKKEIESQFGDFKTFRNLLFGKAMHITTTDSSAMTLDEVWQELSELAPEYFPKDFNELDMPMQLTAFFEAVAPKVVNPYEHFQENMEDAAAELATEIFQKYYEVGRLQSTQEKYKNLVYENMQKLERNKKAMRQEFKNKVEENRQLNFENYRKRVTEYKQQREAGDRRRKLKNEIDRNYNYLNRRLIRETDNDHIPEALKPLVSAFRFIIPDSNSTFSKARFTEFENEYRKLEEKSSLFDADISERISALCERLTPGIGAPKMRELDLFELEELRNISQHIKFIVQTENKLFSDNLKASRDAFSKAIIDELSDKPDKKSEFLESTVLGLLKPHNLFKRFGSEKLVKLYENLREGENIAANIQYDARIREQEIKKSTGYDPKWKHETKSLEFRSGKVNLTIEQIMAIYATSKREQGRAHLLGGGIKIYTTKDMKQAAKAIRKSEKDKGKKDLQLPEIQTVYLDETDIGKIERILSPSQKKYADTMVEYITKVIGEKRNDVSMRLYGIKKYEEKYYYPIMTDKAFLPANLGKQETESKIQYQSAAKNTVKGAENAVIISDFTETVNHHIYESSLYCGYVIPIADFNKVFNFTDKIPVGEGIESLIYRDISVQNELRRVGGKNAVDELKNFLVAVDSGSRTDNIIPGQARLMSKVKKSAVMGNLSVVIQQPTALYRAMLYVDPKYFGVSTWFGPLSSMTWANKKEIEEMRRFNGCALVKEIGYFDVNMGRTATDYIGEYKVDKAQYKDWNITDKLNYFKDNGMERLDSFMGWAASKADEKTWGAIWKACKKQTKAENSELSGDALCEAAAELFQKTIAETQVYDSVFTKCPWMRKKEGLAMMMMQFMSEPITSLNMYYQAIQEVKKTKKGTDERKNANKMAARAFGGCILSTVYCAVAKGIVQSMRDDDEDESFLEKWVANIITNSILDPIGMLPMIKDIVSALQGYDLERTDAAVFGTVAETIEVLMNDNKGVDEKIFSIFKALSQTTGIPFMNIARDVKGFINLAITGYKAATIGKQPTTAKGVGNIMKENFAWLPLIESSSNYEQLYSSIIDQDTRHYDKVYNNLIADGKEKSTIESGIAKVLAEKNGTLAEVYTLTAEGKATDAANKINELKAAGFSDNIINKALNTYESNRVKELSEDERTEQAAKARYNRNYEEYERIISELVDEGNKESIVIKAIDKNKLELETKAADYSFDSEDTYDASYDLKNPIISGDDKALKAVYNRYAKEHGEEDARSKIKTQIVNACKDKFISETKAESLLREYVFEEESDVFWQMEEIRTGGKYTKLKSAVDSGAVNRSVIEYYTDNGVEEGTVKQWLTNNYKSKLLSLEKGSAEYNELYDTLIDAYVASGMTEGKAKKKIREWYKE